MSNSAGLPISDEEPPQPFSGQQWVRGDLDPPELRVYLNENIYRVAFTALEEPREAIGERDPRDQEPEAVPVDPEGEQSELEAAGWERVEEPQGKIFW